MAGVIVPASLQIAHAVRNARYEPSLLPICRVDTGRPVLALTFDDGPSTEYTRRVLDALRGSEAVATFFVLGEHAAASQPLVRRELRSGMEVANHTWSHMTLEGGDPRAARTEIVRTQALLRTLGSASPSVRPPLGLLDASHAAILDRLGLQPILWSIAVDHMVGGEGLTTREAVSALLDRVRPGDIILLHDAPVGGNDSGELRRKSLQVLVRSLPLLREAGYRFVTVSGLLQMGSPIHAQPRPWFWQSGFRCP
jgi:peptidoglycan/xylan/chitin deacetylase (PgdA/CDA1 family)